MNAGAYSFEAAKAWYEHEYQRWETVRLTAGKMLIPGVIMHSSNIVEHPEWIAERNVSTTLIHPGSSFRLGTAGLGSVS